MKTSKREFNKKLILLVCSAVYFGLVLVLTSFISRAAGDIQSPDLYYPIHQNTPVGDLQFSDGMISQIESIYDSENNYIFAFYSDNVGGLLNVYVSYTPKALGGCFYGEIKNTVDHFGLYTIGTTNWNCRLLRFDPSNLSNYQNININNNVFLNLGYNDYPYVSNFQMYNNNDPETQIVILAYGESDEGIGENDTYPEDSEKPSLDDYYDPSEAPSFDNSSTTNAIESIFDVLSWFFNNGIGGIINFLVDNTNWAFQKVINNIKNVITELQEAVSDFSDTVSGFLSDIQDLVSDLKDKLSDFYDGFMDFADLFIHPFDEEEFEEQIAECQLITQYDELLDNCDIIREVFETAQEKDSFILYIDFENPFADSEHKIITSEINFNWLVPLRSVYRPFLWVFALLDCFIGGCQLLGSIIGGKAK